MAKPPLVENPGVDFKGLTDFAPTLFSAIFAARYSSVVATASETKLEAKGPVAQLNRASDYGSEGFRFES